MTPPDQLDVDELERFERSHIGEAWMKRIIDMGTRHTRMCQDRRATMEEIRASQGALEVVYAVLGLGDTLRKEIAGRKKRDGPN
jgi:hypothetical protein